MTERPVTVLCESTLGAKGQQSNCPQVQELHAANLVHTLSQLLSVGQAAEASTSTFPQGCKDN